ncbi:MAG TPA: hypothetical protein PLG34_03500 [Spirochaetota bacterium]|nr:hypothetical protein [Spirochaetota bacterium]HQB61571.1 hypothetical protein [Spirochaetota bacterium]
MGNTGNTCVINSALYEPGVYNLTLFAYKNGIMYSASIIFTIIN